MGKTAPSPPPPVRTTVGISKVDLNVLEEHRVRITGVLRPRLAKRIIDLQLRRDAHWRTVAHTWTGLRGRFTLRYTPRRILSERIRIRFAGDRTDSYSDRYPGRLNVYRLAEASWYGGGGSLACGGTLTSSTLGVANKTLPCGTLVTLRYGNHTVRVPVVDRGPYVAGREYDLTEATKRALGFEGVGEVWSIS
jgi:hypothetical protein